MLYIKKKYVKENLRTVKGIECNYPQVSDFFFLASKIRPSITDLLLYDHISCIYVLNKYILWFREKQIYIRKHKQKKSTNLTMLKENIFVMFTRFFCWYIIKPSTVLLLLDEMIWINKMRHNDNDNTQNNHEN